ncbi:LacI family DNA-binding transcriptional regulator [Arthrobacter oryzae]|uniref:LacI family DNA-binding transcriptional regulator n=1 Tax=Arthrobacter oryzae TaxID=409290 RepID=UPI00273B5EAC|nr:LacI family DNA-binding transcriptional regulator [Arthrobacter oryzae]WLQ07661.1 LacI family DNA-binding transcriptional regulator [Arthrobacter oryzae]
MSRPTLASLASDLGVSRQTISNVLNAPHKVRPATRERVQAAITAAGYRPSAAARQLRTQRSMNLGMRLLPATDGINGAVLDRFLHALTEAAQAAGYRLTLFCADSDDDEILHYGQLLDVAGLDGFILTSSTPDDPRTRWLTERGTPFAVFGRPWGAAGHPAVAAHPWVDVDGAAGTEAAARMLLAQGHSRIGFVGWYTGDPVGADRRRGWERAMGSSGYGADTGFLCVEVEDTVAGGAAGAALLVSRGATAVVCSSDSLALGALGEIRESQFGPVLPGQPERPVAVVGFDNTPVAAALGLSSVAQPVEDAARHIVRVLAHVLAGYPGESPPGAAAAGTAAAPEKQLLLEPQVVERIPLPLAARPRGASAKIHPGQ